MAGGRPPLGVKLVDGLEGSEEARSRLKVLLETIVGTRTIESAAEALCINGSRVHQLRSEALEAALGALEPRPTGRPRKDGQGGADDASGALRRRLEELTARCEALEREQMLSRAREELHAVMPYLGERARKREEAGKKTPPR